MKNTILVLMAAALVFHPAAGQDPQKPTPAELMEMYQKRNAPGPEHELLEKMAGRFRTTTRYYQPGGEPWELEGVTDNRLILGGRFLACDAKFGKADLENESHVILGYETRYERYINVTFDTMGTYYVTAAGQYDPESRTLVMTGQDEDPMEGTRNYDFVTRFLDGGRFVNEIVFKFPGGAEHKAVEVEHIPIDPAPKR